MFRKLRSALLRGMIVVLPIGLTLWLLWWFGSTTESLLRAVMLNLVLNACQASNGQQVEIETLPGDGVCHIEVRDRGPGIPAEIRDKIFDPFFTTKSCGTGLGLPIVKRLMEAQGGHVRLRPRDGGGTVAEVSLPRHHG